MNITRPLTRPLTRQLTRPLSGGVSGVSGGNPPVNTVLPVISGTLVVGQSLSVTNGTWTGTTPISYAYQWRRNSSNISGATSSNYTLVQADAGSVIDCQVTATNAVDSTVATANATTTIFDMDALAYITAVEAADTQALEVGVKDAINAFVVGCKLDGIWTSIKASCILAGARTLDGALVPLVGASPTNLGPFVSGDYNRKTGIQGNGSKSINTNRPSNSDPQDNVHGSLFIFSRQSDVSRYLAADIGLSSFIIANTTGFRSRINSTTIVVCGTGTTVPSFVGVSRSSPTGMSWRGLGQSGTASNTSTGTTANDHRVFGVSPNFTDIQIAFYSIGESINLALLDARVTTLISDIGAAIP